MEFADILMQYGLDPEFVKKVFGHRTLPSQAAGFLIDPDIIDNIKKREKYPIHTPRANSFFFSRPAVDPAPGLFRPPASGETAAGGTSGNSPGSPVSGVRIMVLFHCRQSPNGGELSLTQARQSM